MFYHSHSLVIESTVSLPELPESAQGPADVTLAVAAAAQGMMVPTHWSYQRRRADGQIAYALARQDDGDVVHFPGYADFLLSKDSTQICCHPHAGVPPETVRHLFLDVVFPFVLCRRGGLVFHGSAVATEEGALAFLGPSGSGKSTLAASLVEAGCRLVADDSVLLREEGEDLKVVPSYPGLRLWPKTVAALRGSGPDLGPVAHYLPKRRLGAGAGQFAFSGEPLPLLRAYVLDKAPQEPCSLTRLAARDACLHLVRNTMSLDHDRPEVLKAQFATHTRLARRPIFRTLSYPRNFAVLAEVQRLVLRDLRGG